MKTSAPSTALLQGAGDPVAGWCCRRSTAGERLVDRSVAAAVHDAVDVGDDDVLDARREQQPQDRRAGGTGAGHDHPHVAELLADHAQRVGERGEHHDRGAVLVVVEDRDVQRLAQPRLDLEAARRRDVLQVDAGEAGGDALTIRTISSVSWVSRQIGQASMPANRLNRAALPSMTGSAAAGPMLPRPEHGRTVGDHGDAVALDGQPAGVLGVARRSPCRPGPHRGCRPWRGRHGCGSGAFDAISILPPRCIRKVRSETLWIDDALDRAQLVHDLVGVRGATRGAGDVDAQRLVPGRRSRRGAVTDAAGGLHGVVSWLTAFPPAGTSSRTVIE